MCRWLRYRSTSRTFYANNLWLRRPGPWPCAGAVTAPCQTDLARPCLCADSGRVVAADSPEYYADSPRRSATRGYPGRDGQGRRSGRHWLGRWAGRFDHPGAMNLQKKEKKLFTLFTTINTNAKYIFLTITSRTHLAYFFFPVVDETPQRPFTLLHNRSRIGR